MENKCPYCGAESSIQSKDLTLAEYKCGTFIYTNMYQREKACYENELALLRPIVEAVAGYPLYKTVICDFCQAIISEDGKLGHKLDCPVLTARELVKGWEGK